MDLFITANGNPGVFKASTAWFFIVTQVNKFNHFWRKKILIFLILIQALSWSGFVFCWSVFTPMANQIHFCLFPYTIEYIEYTQRLTSLCSRTTREHSFAWNMAHYEEASSLMCIEDFYNLAYSWFDCICKAPLDNFFHQCKRRHINKDYLLPIYNLPVLNT